MINDGNLVLAFAIICSLSVTRIYLVVKVPLGLKVHFFWVYECLLKIALCTHFLLYILYYILVGYAEEKKKILVSSNIFSLLKFIIKVPTSAHQLPKPGPRDSLHLGASSSIPPSICCACLCCHLHPLSRLVSKYLASNLSDHGL